MSPARLATLCVAVLTAAVVTPVAVVANGADSAPTAASCSEPTTSEAAGGVVLGVACLVPTPPPVTETATETITETTTATATVTVTASPSSTPTPAAKKLIGMSAGASLWSTRLAEVGACGVEARRIFGDLISTGRSQSGPIETAIAQGMLPVVSYKGTVTASTVTATRNYLVSLGVPVVAVWHHEPHGDMTPDQFRSQSSAFFDLMDAPSITVGPILNGWLLDNRVADWASYTSPALLDKWEFLGYDSYQQGSRDNPSSWGDGPDRTVPLVENWLDQQGHGDMRILVGEYNAYEASEVAEMGEAALSTPEIWAALVFNSDVGAKGEPLTGERLAAYKATKADARALHDPPC